METALIFEPHIINGLTLANQIIMAPMARSRYANPGNVAPELMALYYKQRASAGLIIKQMRHSMLQIKMPFTHLGQKDTPITPH